MRGPADALRDAGFGEPPMARGSGRLFPYAYGLTGAENEDELGLICHGNFPTEQDARETATRRQAQGEWRPVPGQVPPKPSRPAPLAPGR